MRAVVVLAIVAAVSIVVAPFLIYIGISAQLARSQSMDTQTQICASRSGYLEYLKRHQENEVAYAPSLFDSHLRDYLAAEAQIEQDEYNRIKGIYDASCSSFKPKTEAQ